MPTKPKPLGIYEFTRWFKPTKWIFTVDGYIRYGEWCEMEANRIYHETGKPTFVEHGTYKSNGREYDICCIKGEWEQPVYEIFTEMPTPLCEQEDAEFYRNGPRENVHAEWRIEG